MAMNRGLPGCLSAALALLVAALPAAAQSTIYRCHALDGRLVFQDKPCNATDGTREAAANSEGEAMAVAPTPPQEGTSAAEHYNRYLDFLARDRREQQAADEAETARLRAQAEADRAAAAAAPPPLRPADCGIVDADGNCVASGYGFVLPYGYGYGYGPHPHRRPDYRDGPYRSPPDNPRTGPRPPGPNPPPQPRTRDARSEILSLSPTP